MGGYSWIYTGGIRGEAAAEAVVEAAADYQDRTHPLFSPI